MLQFDDTSAQCQLRLEITDHVDLPVDLPKVSVATSPELTRTAAVRQNPEVLQAVLTDPSRVTGFTWAVATLAFSKFDDQRPLEPVLISVNEIKQIAGYSGNSAYDRLRETAKSITRDLHVEFHSVGGTKKTFMAAVPFPTAIVKGGMLCIWINAQVGQLLRAVLCSSPLMNLSAVTSLHTLPAQRLYGVAMSLLEPRLKKADVFPIEMFRLMLGTPTTRFVKSADFYIGVVKVALKAVNPVFPGVVSVNPVKTGKRITHFEVVVDATSALVNDPPLALYLAERLVANGFAESTAKAFSRKYDPMRILHALALIESKTGPRKPALLNKFITSGIVHTDRAVASARIEADVKLFVNKALDVYLTEAERTKLVDDFDTAVVRRTSLRVPFEAVRRNVRDDAIWPAFCKFAFGLALRELTPAHDTTALAGSAAA